MKHLFSFLFLFLCLGIQAQKVVADKTSVDGGRLVVTSREKFGEVKDNYANSLRLAYLQSDKEEMYIINMQLKRNNYLSIDKGRVVLFKLADDKILEFHVSDVEDTYDENRLQRIMGSDARVTGFEIILKPSHVEDLIYGPVRKIRVETADFNEDIVMSDNSFSELLNMCKYVIMHKIKEKKRSVYDDF